MNRCYGSRRAFLFLLPLLLTVVAARSRAVRPEINVPTFNKEVVRILQQNCQSCHHPGDVAPFSLMTFDEAYEQRHLIRFMTQTRQMPPWKPAQGCGEFKDVRRLTDQQIDLMARWVDAGAPQGNLADLPPPLVFKDGWAEGQPDLVLTMPEAYTPPSDREMYRCFPIPAGTSERKWVSAIDVRPGDRQSVHHVIAFIDSTGASVSLDQQDPGPGYQCFGGPGFTTVEMLGGWAPGTRPNFLPDGVALSLAANSRVVLQVHYHPHGTAPVADSTEIGLYYADKPVDKELRLLPIANIEFTIPAGHSNYEVNATFTTPIFLSGRLYVIFPHMHLLGKRMKVDATVIGGEKVCLIDIPDWDFKWQGGYAFKDPVPLPGGTRLDMSAWYDNSANNPRNPNNPPKPVSWGEATTDEMALVFLGFALD